MLDRALGGNRGRYHEIGSCACPSWPICLSIAVTGSCVVLSPPSHNCPCQGAACVLARFLESISSSLRTVLCNPTARGLDARPAYASVQLLVRPCTRLAIVRYRAPPLDWACSLRSSYVNGGWAMLRFSSVPRWPQCEVLHKVFASMF